MNWKELRIDFIAWLTVYFFVIVGESVAVFMIFLADKAYKSNLVWWHDDVLAVGALFLMVISPVIAGAFYALVKKVVRLSD